MDHVLILVTRIKEAAVSDARKTGKRQSVSARLDQDYRKIEKPVKKIPHQLILVTETMEAAVTHARNGGKIRKRHAVCARLDQDYRKIEKPVKKFILVTRTKAVAVLNARRRGIRHSVSAHLDQSCEKMEKPVKKRVFHVASCVLKPTVVMGR